MKLKRKIKLPLAFTPFIVKLPFSSVTVPSIKVESFTLNSVTLTKGKTSSELASITCPLTGTFGAGPCAEATNGTKKHRFKNNKKPIFLIIVLFKNFIKTKIRQ